MEKFSLLYLLLLPFSLFSQIQYDANWTFGEAGGVILDFDSEEPEIKNVDIDFNLASGSSTISNKDGELQFFTNGCEIRNKNYALMLNGDSIGLPGNPFCSTNYNPLINTNVILPSFERSSIYYLIHIGFTSDINDTASLYLTTVDMEKDGGLGAVVNKKEFIFSDYFSRNGMELTLHENGKDWWVIIPKYNSDCYHTLLFNEGEFRYDTLQCIGQEWDIFDVQNQHDFSPDGKKYARFSFTQGLNIFDFDNSIGLFSNHLNIDFGFSDEFFHSGVIFSANSKLVYTSTVSNVYQFNLYANDISESRVDLGVLNTPSDFMFNTRFTRGFLGPDGKIYIGGRFQYNHLHVIHNPDCAGLICDLEQYAIQLNEFPHFCDQGVPNIPHFRNRSQEINCDTVGIVSNTSTLFDSDSINTYPNPVDGLLTIEIRDNIFDFTSIKIASVLGQEVMSFDIANLQKDKIKIPMSSFESGVYYILFLDSQDKIRARKKVIKL